MFKILKEFFKVKTDKEVRREKILAHVARCLRCCDRFGRVVFGPFDVRKVDGVYVIDGCAICLTAEDVAYYYEAWVDLKKINIF